MDGSHYLYDVLEGLIPTYLLVKELHMLNTIWSLVIPGLCSAYTIVIIRNFFTSLPVEVEESAYIDGANDFPYSSPLFCLYLRRSLPR